jgi:hypothetical protein
MSFQQSSSDLSVNFSIDRNAFIKQFIYYNVAHQLQNKPNKSHLPAIKVNRAVLLRAWCKTKLKTQRVLLEKASDSLRHHQGLLHGKY